MRELFREAAVSGRHAAEPPGTLFKSGATRAG